MHRVSNRTLETLGHPGDAADEGSRDERLRSTLEVSSRVAPAHLWAASGWVDCGPAEGFVPRSSLTLSSAIWTLCAAPDFAVTGKPETCTGDA